MSRHTARIRLYLVGCLVAASSVTPCPSGAAESNWRTVTEAGVTYQPAESPIDPYLHPTHWRWTGVGGAIRRLGASDAAGPVLLGSYSEHDYTAGAGLRWEHEFGDSWGLLVTPGFALQDLVKGESEVFTGYFAEVGVSYRRWVTLAARREAIRHTPENFLEGPPPDAITESVWRFDARVGRAPGAIALGAAALFLIGLGVGQATDAR
ncbi:MAG TPA: hypothetical protein VI198_01595 [Candidatus Eisenbacteria bacterium]